MVIAAGDSIFPEIIINNFIEEFLDMILIEENYIIEEKMCMFDQTCHTFIWNC